MWLPGVLAAAAAALAAWGIHSLVPTVPLLTAAVALGIIAAQLPFARPALTGVLAPGLAVASTRLMRIGIVLLGLKLSLVDIAGLGWVAIISTVGIVLFTFVGTLWLGRRLGLPGHQPLLIATGFSVCGASAIGAMSGVVRAKDEESAVPIALVTLCGTLAIAVLPALWHPLGLSDLQFGHWVGAGVHDVGQVVATAQVAGSAALAVAVVIKLTRVLMLAPLVAVVAIRERGRFPVASGEPVRGRISTFVGPGKVDLRPLSGSGDAANAAASRRPPLVPLFVAGFIAAVLVRTFLPLPAAVVGGADTLQTALLAMALFALGSAVRLGELVRTGGRSLLVGLLSWALIALLAFGAVHLA
ncbi:YeiH family protein [Cryobacterium tagatosivorans]|uniref:Putative sulfate exporter family transporter n=1 Tax=Cryobacterium tagatosivorans TaxID=1259199 RepID=A0A4R8UFF6_9MICO|nr:putative sulfate exporter family transporter [Cryobacterium tagatosivorans]TFB51511.1 putative sulfate exporter family transporter [Cryobacterium tagatosivorans]